MPAVFNVHLCGMMPFPYFPCNTCSCVNARENLVQDSLSFLSQLDSFRIEIDPCEVNGVVQFCKDFYADVFVLHYNGKNNRSLTL